MAQKPENIFEAIEEAGDRVKEVQKVDLGPISVLVEKQAMFESKADPNLVRRLNKVIVDYKISIDTIESCLKDRKKELFRVKQQQIPEMLKGFGLNGVEALDGTSIEIKKDFSITKKSEPKIFTYLRKHKAGDLIKNQVIVTVDDEKERKEVIKTLDKTSCSYEAKETIHSGTLKKYIKELKEKGKALPEDAVSVFDYEYSKIK